MTVMSVSGPTDLDGVWTTPALLDSMARALPDHDAVVAENASARLVALRTALSVVALVIVVALLFTRMVPDQSLVGDGPPPRDGRRRRRRHAS